jgi:hypothetical protein
MKTICVHRLSVLTTMLLAVWLQPASLDAAAPDSAAPSLPFAWDVAQKKLTWVENCDYPMRQAVIDGEVWIMHVPNNNIGGPKCAIHRFKGPDMDHLVRQPDGYGEFPGASCFLGCGLWWDEQTRTVYGLMHSEYGGNNNGQQAWVSKKTRLVTSKDKGLTWTLVGDVLTRALPNVADYSGSFFEMGPADFDFYADTRGGYFYVTCWNGFVPKIGRLNSFATHCEVARCAIADKMAPGKWFKYRNGQWTEPGLGGKASRVAGMQAIYGNTIYSTYLNKYVRVGIHAGVADPRFPCFGFADSSVCVSTCTDLAKQDWSPLAKLTDEPKNPVAGFTLTDGKGIDPVTCGQTLRAYNYWQNVGDRDRVLTISLKAGSTPCRVFPAYCSYAYEPHPESGDPIESRKTRIVGCADPAVHYDGDGWTTEKSEHYYQGQARTAAKAGQTIQFPFQGSAVYWRAVYGPDAGKVDVYVDGTLEKTVDCFFDECALPYQFAFIKTGLDPKQPHTIKIVVRGDKNAASSGTKIRHIAFECGT